MDGIASPEPRLFCEPPLNNASNGPHRQVYSLVPRFDLTDRSCRNEVGKAGRAAGSSGGPSASGSVDLVTWEGEGSRARAAPRREERVCSVLFGEVIARSEAGAARTAGIAPAAGRVGHRFTRRLLDRHPERGAGPPGYDESRPTRRPCAAQASKQSSGHRQYFNASRSCCAMLARLPKTPRTPGPSSAVSCRSRLPRSSS